MILPTALPKSGAQMNNASRSTCARSFVKQTNPARMPSAARATLNSNADDRRVRKET
jgi:hypothetical protein